MKKRWYVILPAVAVVVTVVIFRTVFLLGCVTSESMEPTLKKGNIIFGFRLYGELHTGDIVIFRYDDKLLVKRIAASPGEIIDHNGIRLTVPDGNFYLLGDNSENSFDSRYWDEVFVKAEDIVAKLL